MSFFFFAVSERKFTSKRARAYVCIYIYTSTAYSVFLFIRLLSDQAEIHCWTLLCTTTVVAVCISNTRHIIPNWKAIRRGVKERCNGKKEKFFSLYGLYHVPKTAKRVRGEWRLQYLHTDTAHRCAGATIVEGAVSKHVAL